jgi:hypothetical protein
VPLAAYRREGRACSCARVVAHAHQRPSDAHVDLHEGAKGRPARTGFGDMRIAASLLPMANNAP